MKKQKTCPYCNSCNVVKNGRKKNGKQNFLCRGCRKQYQGGYKYKGVGPMLMKLAIRMLCRGSGVRDVEAVLGFHLSTVLSLLGFCYDNLPDVKPRERH